MSGRRTIDDEDRGQAHTLEAFSAGLILLASVVFALQTTAVTPLTASTASQHIENQQAAVGEGLLDAAVENGTLKKTVLFYNNSSGRFHNTSESLKTYSTGGPPTAFGERLNRTFLQRGIAFDVNVLYVNSRNVSDRKKMVDLGVPSDHAVTIRRTITLYDDDHIYYANGSINTNTTVEESGIYSGQDMAPDSRVYNVVIVELVIWRM